MIRFGGQPEHRQGIADVGVGIAEELPQPRKSESRKAKCTMVRAVSSVVEHRLYTPAVTGSNPVPPTRELRIGHSHFSIPKFVLGS